MNSPKLTAIQNAVLSTLPKLQLPPGARVLDAPCGNTAALTLALIHLGFEAVGADIDSEAAKPLGNAYDQVDLNALFPWKDQNFDAVISTEGIEHLENHFFFLREIWRILKSEGILFSQLLILFRSIPDAIPGQRLFRP